MSSRIYSIIVLIILGINFSHAQQRVSIDVDLRGRDCGGGRGICGVNKLNAPHKNFTLEKTDGNSLVLTLSRTGLTFAEEAGIAGKSLTDFQSVFPNIFVQNEDIIFGKDVLKALDIDVKYNLLKKGNYPMIINESEVKITLFLVKDHKT